MTNPTPVTIREPSAWLRTTARHRARGLARTARKATERHPGSTIVAALGIGQDLTQGSRHDRTCDRCRTYVPPTEKFGVSLYPITIDTTPVMLIVGLCNTHMRAEVPNLDELNVPTLDQLDTALNPEAHR